jgi:hypothetical protein
MPPENQLLDRLVMVRRAIMQRILGTRAWRTRLRREIIILTHHQISAFERLRSLNDETKQALIHQLRHHVIRATAEVALMDSLSISVGLLVALAVTSAVTVPLIFFARHFAPYSIMHSPLATLSASIAPLLMAYLLNGIAKNAGLLQSLSFYAFTFLGPTLLGPVIVCLATWPHPTTPAISAFLSSHPVVLGLLLGSSGSLFIGSLDFSMNFISNLGRSRVFRNQPNSALVYYLLVIVSQLEQYRRRWADAVMKRELIVALETTAACVRVGLVHGAPTRDLTVQAWFESEAERKASAIRSLKRWVLTPKSDSYDALLRRLADMLRLAALGELDSLPSEDASPKTRENAWSRISKMIVALPSVTLPLCVLWLFRQLRLVEGTNLLVLTVGAFVWATLALLAAIDPLYDQRMDLIKGAVSWLSERKTPK